MAIEKVLIVAVAGSLENGHSCELGRGIDSSGIFTADLSFDDEIDAANFETARRHWHERRAACPSCNAIENSGDERPTLMADEITSRLREMGTDLQRATFLRAILAEWCENCGGEKKRLLGGWGCSSCGQP